MGAVLHTLNIRLFPEQLVYIANHAEDKVVIVDGSLVPLLAPSCGDRRPSSTCSSPARRAATDLGLDGLGQGRARLRRAARRAAEDFDWPEVDERDAAAMCYTSGTTGNPKGVVYSHRSA